MPANYFYENLLASDENYYAVMSNLNPESLSNFFKEMGIPADQTKNLLIKTLNYVVDHSDEFDV